MVANESAIPDDLSTTIIEAYERIVRCLGEPSLDLSVNEYRLLNHLARNTPGSASKKGIIASPMRRELLHTNPAAFARLTDGLGQKGLIKTERGSEDRRCRYIQLTSRGRDLVTRSWKALAEISH